MRYSIVLSILPQQILSHSWNENMSEFVLHEICNQSVLTTKAAFLVDNPDFDCLKGVAGYSTDEAYATDTDLG